MNEINRWEKDSILYYQGGGEDIVLCSENENLKEFYNVDNSYLVINALLMPGIGNENARLKEEGKKVSITMFKHMDELIKVYCRLYSAICKYTYFYKHEDRYYTYRTDRMNTLEFLEHGQMYSFMSTKKCKDKNTDFHDKDGILLLEVDAWENIEHIDVNAVLGEQSKYPFEQEILFAPFVLLDKELLEMTEEEKLYRDIHGNPPKAKYLLHLRLSSIVSCKADIDKKLEKLYKEIMDPDFINIVQQVWEMLMSGKKPEADAVQCYIRWKEKLQIYLRMCFGRIKYEMIIHDLNGNDTKEAAKNEEQGADYKQDINSMQKLQKRLNKLEKDVRNYYDYTDEKRKKYKHYVQVVNGIVSVLSPLTALFVALSLSDNLQTFMKVAGLLTSTISVIVPLIAKGFAWNEKLQQRTSTYMKLDRLMRDMEYEKSLDENSLDGYVECYKEIVDEDNRMGLNNVLIMKNYLEHVIKESEKKQGTDNGKKE